MKKLSFLSMGMLLLYSATVCSAQNIINDLKKINQVFSAEKELSIKATYLLYASHISNEVVEKQQAVIKRSGNNYYQKFGQIENITNDKVTIAIDHGNKVITVANPKTTNTGSIFPIPLDSLKPLIVNEKYAESTPGFASYTFEFNSSTYEKASITFNKNSFKIKSFIFYYKASSYLDKGAKVKPRLEIQFAEDLAPIAKAVFSESKFIKWNGKDILLQPAYSTYKLINQTYPTKK